MTVSNIPNLVVGTGTYVYDVVRPWGLLPAGHSFGLISHVAVDSQDRVYFYQRKDPPIIIFDGDGNFLGGWGDGRLRDAHGIYIGPDDHLYVCNRDEHEVLKLTADGLIVLTLGHRGRPAQTATSTSPMGTATRPCTCFLRRAGTWVPGELRGPDVDSSPRPTGFGWTPPNACWSLIARTTGCSSSAPRVTCMESGVISTIPWTFTSTGAGRFTSPTRFPGSRCMPPTDRCSPVAGRRPMVATGCGETPVATSTWPRSTSPR